jgi:hypothetical protein
MPMYMVLSDTLQSVVVTSKTLQPENGITLPSVLYNANYAQSLNLDQLQRNSCGSHAGYRARDIVWWDTAEYGTFIAICALQCQLWAESFRPVTTQ